MCHIEVTAFDAPPCKGRVVRVEVPASHRPLPVLGREPAAQAQWRCESCGRLWSREPLPDEAL